MRSRRYLTNFPRVGFIRTWLILGVITGTGAARVRDTLPVQLIVGILGGLLVGGMIAAVTAVIWTALSSTRLGGGIARLHWGFVLAGSLSLAGIGALLEGLPNGVVGTWICWLTAPTILVWRIAPHNVFPVASKET